VSELLYVGVDVGGTKVAAGLVDANGRILSQIRVPMVSHSSAEAGLNAVLGAVAQVSAGFERNRRDWNLLTRPAGSFFWSRPQPA
jgi:predicted NBD/HSP70 family sugar kinase